MKGIIGVVFLVSLVITSPMAVAEGEVERANQLVAEGKYIEAFELLEPLEFDLSGDENFDLLFGFTALEAGHVSLATLALERVLAVNPDNDTGRFHLARAYFVLSDFDGARREFEMLLSMNPTAGIRETVGQYLDAIAAREPRAATVVTGFLAYGIGSDSNITGGTSENSIFFPGFDQEIPIGEADVEDEDSYGNLSAGIDLVHRFRDDVSSVYAGGDLIDRAHQDRDDLDYQIATLRGGYQRAVGNQVYRAGIGAGYLRLDEESYQESGSLELEWRNSLGQRSQVGVVLDRTDFRHRDEINEVSDYNDLKLSLSYLRVLGEQGDKLLSVALDLGQEDDINDREDGDADYAELSLTGQIQFSDKFSGFLLLAARENDYDKENESFTKKRRDSQTTLVGGLVFEFGNSFSIRTTVVISDTSSNISLYDTSREDISVSLRKDFL